MSLVYWDSMLFVYLLERNPRFLPIIETIHNEMTHRGDTLCTSIFTVGELLVVPRRFGSQSGADRVLNFFAGGTIRMLSFDLETANQFALVRAWTGASPPDAIHLASAAQAQVGLFLTNDRKLQTLKIPGIAQIAGLDPNVLNAIRP
ncbi:MAG TPA: PIN domain-containing protein [Terracidiphilus sp.]|nr:PIN domain-containing protein [Terracidiphilus sp.]